MKKNRKPITMARKVGEATFDDRLTELAEAVTESLGADATPDAVQAGIDEALVRARRQTDFRQEMEILYRRTKAELRAQWAGRNL